MRRRSLGWASLAAAVGMLSLCPSERARAGEGEGAARTTVLTETQSPWRVFCTWKTELMRLGSGELQPCRILAGSRWEAAPVRRTPLPPAAWTGPDLDDSTWSRFQGSIPDGSRELALQCLRGKFLVKDPKAVRDLTLSLAYRGGVVVYLNGTEVARGHLPQGAVEPETLAEDYGKDAYVDPEGMLLRKGFGDPEKYPERFAMRTRRLDGVTVPGALLREGVNVLAVEVHRAPTAEVQITGRARSMMSQGASYSQWTMLGLEDLALTAAATPALVPNVAPPAGVRVWNQSSAQRVRVVDFADPCETLKPVRLEGCRNGAFSGQVVVSSDQPIRNLKVQPGELRRKGASGVIPADAMRVRFALPDGEVYRAPNWFDGLAESAPAVVSAQAGVAPVAGNRWQAALQPVWFTVRVPRDAPPGDYEGAVTVTAEAAPDVTVPLVLRVADWVLPDPDKFVSHVGLIQSPESEALQYNVPLWSEEHWRLLDKAFAVLAETGADDLFIPAICRTVVGNEFGMVRWVKRPDGGYTHDFGLVERYVDVATKRLGKAPVVCLYLWDRQGGGWMGWGTRKFEQDKGPPFTVLDPATGDLSEAEGPKWGTPESIPFWKPVVEGMQALLAKRGLEKSLMFGVAMDQRPPQETFDDLKAIAPEVPWVLHSHSGPIDVLQGAPVGYGAFVHVTRHIPDPAVQRPYGWQTRNIFTAFPRYGAGGAGALRGHALGLFRWQVEGLMVSGHRGFGRVGADFWPVVGPAGRKNTVYCRFGEQVSIQLKDSNPAVLAPGPDGAMGTVRFELIREGVQETEARVFVEKALTDPALRARLGADLAERAQALLDERVRRILVMTAGLRTMGGWPLNWDLFDALPWQEDSARLYEAAAEVARKTVE